MLVWHGCGRTEGCIICAVPGRYIICGGALFDYLEGGLYASPQTHMHEETGQKVPTDCRRQWAFSAAVNGGLVPGVRSVCRRPTPSPPPPNVCLAVARPPRARATPAAAAKAAKPAEAATAPAGAGGSHRRGRAAGVRAGPEPVAVPAVRAAAVPARGFLKHF